MNECTYGTCDKSIWNKTYGLCSGHNQQRLQGVPLRPLGKRSPRGSNAGPCSYEGCKEPPHSSRLCTTHYNQNKTYGVMWDKGKPKPEGVNKVKKDGYSTDRYCRGCKTTVDWKKYYLAVEMCRECYKEYIKRETPITAPGAKVRQNPTVEEVLASIESLCEHLWTHSPIIDT